MHSKFKNIQPADWLLNEFAKRKAANKRYSLRAFANFLDIPSGRLSELLKGKRQFTVDLGKKMSRKLNLNKEDTQLFLASIAEHRPKLSVTSKSQTNQKPLRQNIRYEVLPDDIFRSIADWEHHAILCLFQTRGFCSNATWIAQRLGITLDATSSEMLDKNWNRNPMQISLM